MLSRPARSASVPFSGRSTASARPTRRSSAGTAHDRRTGGTLRKTTRIDGDRGPVPDPDRPDHLGPGGDEDVIAQDRHPVRSHPQGDLVVERHIRPCRGRRPLITIPARTTRHEARADSRCR